ncbi:Threonine aldolase [Coemansia guatemalensis]|uniref:Threonine aldolase n=1 Tax=Coemansia guatemalensis TaxID=2761395 RepID=A0A9W8HXF7_9FUNG|nr:Threonine aldolase [Coemansia guatemalensis]
MEDTVEIKTEAGHNWDLRSDTMTKPTAGMLSAMVNAPLGDSVFGEDPTVNKLERRAAELCGKDAALFCVSSTMCNQLAIRCHLLNPPQSLICHLRSHVYEYESGGASMHSQAMMIPVTPANSVNLTAADVQKHLILDNFMGIKAPTGLIALENTFHGTIMPLEDMEDIAALAREHEIPVHIDGSRLWNASVATGISLAEYSRNADSVNLCLSKGMGCPVGAVLVGSTKFINKARHMCKAFGGGWHQAGILAAAGLFAIDHIWPTMKESHALTRRLADELVAMGFDLIAPADTNMILLAEHKQNEDGGSSASEKLHVQLTDALKAKGVIVGAVYQGCLRLVLHHQIDAQCVNIVIATAKRIMHS